MRPNMYAHKRPYRMAGRLALALVLSALTGFGWVVPQVAAGLGCTHACCTISAGPHLQHNHVRISGLSQPTCCSKMPSKPCQLCAFGELPDVAAALHSAPCHENSTATYLSTAQRHRLPEAARWNAGDRNTAASDRGSPPLYIQTLTLLI